MNDRYTFSSLTAGVATSYYNIDTSLYTPNLQSVTYGASTYSIDLNLNTFQYNTYNENYYTHSQGLLTITGSPRTIFQGEVFQKNGEMAQDVTTLYGTGILGVGTREKTFASAINSGSFNSTLLSRGLIEISRTA